MPEIIDGRAVAEFPTETYSKAVYMDSRKLVRATVRATTTGDVIFYLSPDGGSNWESVTNNTVHNFTNSGAELRWRAVGIAPATITYLEIEYEIERV